MHDLKKEGPLRFSDRVKDYALYRPTYPKEVVQFIRQQIVEPTHQSPLNFIDVAAGTGLLSSVFLSANQIVQAVEPNAEMARTAESVLTGYPNFHMQIGTAESTGLQTGEGDAVIVGQAFHWFDVNQSRAEFRRILKPPCWTALIWNKRDKCDTFTKAYGELVGRHEIKERKVHHQSLKDQVISDFFGHSNWIKQQFPNQQTLDLEGLLGRLRSSSYLPATTEAAYPAMATDAASCFNQFSQNGHVKLQYHCTVFIGKLADEKNATPILPG